jgi:hypothetical protein
MNAQALLKDHKFKKLHHYGYLMIYEKLQKPAEIIDQRTREQSSPRSRESEARFAWKRLQRDEIPL